MGPHAEYRHEEATRGATERHLTDEGWHDLPSPMRESGPDDVVATLTLPDLPHDSRAGGSRGCRGLPDVPGDLPRLRASYPVGGVFGL